MLNLLIFLIFIFCLSLLCVYIANIKNLIPHKWKKIVISRGKGGKNHTEQRANKEIEQDYEPHRRSNAHPSEAHSWSVGITGHS